MKTYVHYDASGAVRGVIAVEWEGAAGMTPPKPGLFVAEVEGEIEGLKLNPLDGDLEVLRENLRRLRMPANAGRGSPTQA